VPGVKHDAHVEGEQAAQVLEVASYAVAPPHWVLSQNPPPLVVQPPQFSEHGEQVPPPAELGG